VVQKSEKQPTKLIVPDREYMPIIQAIIQHNFPIRKLCSKNRQIGLKFPDQEIFMSAHIQNSLDLGRLVRETRRRLKLTQPQLALAANVGVRFIVELEAGKSTLRLENILRVLQALGGVLSVEGMDSFISNKQEGVS
jgi:y4mF family transcriptional regulator